MESEKAILLGIWIPLSIFFVIALTSIATDISSMRNYLKVVSQSYEAKQALENCRQFTAK